MFRRFPISVTPLRAILSTPPRPSDSTRFCRAVSRKRPNTLLPDRMANVILRGLAIAAGTGLAMGLTSGCARTVSGPRAVRYRPAVALPPPPQEPLALTSRDEILDIEPLLDRVERLEDAVDGMKRSPAGAPADFAAAVASLERRIDEQTRDLELLRQQVEQAERRAMESVAAIERDVE